MADFCKDCSVKMFGEDYRELAGLISPEKVAKGFGALVICEGCGPTYVDHDGKCISKHCEECKHYVSAEPQPIADQTMLRCKCGWTATVSWYEGDRQQVLDKGRKLVSEHLESVGLRWP